MSVTKASAEVNLKRARKAEELAAEHNVEAVALTADVATIASLIDRAFVIANGGGSVIFRDENSGARARGA